MDKKKTQVTLPQADKISTSPVQKRREFIKSSLQYGTTIAATGILGNKLLSSCQTSPITKNKPQSTSSKNNIYEADVLVLGAGIAGLTAAQYLSRPDFLSTTFFNGKKKINYRPQSVIVIEGNNRIGGRIHTKRDFFPGENWPIELGAEFVHRKPPLDLPFNFEKLFTNKEFSYETPIWAEIERYKLNWVEIEKLGKGLIFHHSKAKKMSSLEAALQWNIISAAKMFPLIDNSLQTHKKDLSAEQWIKEKYMDDELGRDFVAMTLTGHMPGPLNEISIHGFAADYLSKQLKERHEWYLTGGYGSLCDRMAENLNIMLSHKIEKITYGQKAGEGVIIDAVDDNGSHKQFRAKTAICTFAVGMLNSGSVEFSPPLHERKLEALKTIKAGHHTKIQMVFDKKFWPKDMSMAHIPQASAKDLMHFNMNGKAAKTTGIPRKAGKSYFHVFGNDPSKPAVLTALIMAEDAETISIWDNDTVMEAICSDLDRMFPEAQGTLKFLRKKKKPTNRDSYMIQRTEWMKDPWAKGGNSYLAVHDSESVPVQYARKILSDPTVSPNLFWAGEAVALNSQPASVHGAHFSGIRAALEIHNFTLNGRYLGIDNMFAMNSAYDYRLSRLKEK
ncbi:MAG: NAD(P)/FAD-dependent oxidoreductase [Bdellovibrionota bacterium]